MASVYTVIMDSPEIDEDGEEICIDLPISNWSLTEFLVTESDPFIP